VTIFAELVIAPVTLPTLAAVPVTDDPAVMLWLTAALSERVAVTVAALVVAEVRPAVSVREAVTLDALVIAGVVPTLKEVGAGSTSNAAAQETFVEPQEPPNVVAPGVPVTEVAFQVTCSIPSVVLLKSLITVVTPLAVNTAPLVDVSSTAP
jgi:hypothetical protein